MSYSVILNDFDNEPGQTATNHLNRYWKDTYLIIFDNHYEIGDKVLSLYPNDDNTFTTVYYRGTISELPNRDNNNFYTVLFDDDDTAQLPLCITMNNIPIPTIITKKTAKDTSSWFECQQKQNQS